MNPFEQALANYMGAGNLAKVQSITIGIAGAGGLGSNCAFNLVRSGFRKFVIVDFDVLEYSNLNRQFYFMDQIGRPKVEALKENLLRINPDIEVSIFQTRLESDNLEVYFGNCDIIVEAFDTVESKKMIVSKYMNSQKKLLVSASGLAGWGNSDDIKVSKIKDSFYLVGDLQSGVCHGVPPISPRVNIAAAKLADIILANVLSD
ncbi:thiamine biosynthesis protein ThiF [Desulfuribacillus stibiiarsenatis]|uniref:Thiamine biosynthesis protein ThiF n=1 Tax=Desulfuribacillus stibiiarsenatis TaxID=1390249 RepID=A0A1E5L7R4_9FIRM|nr:sulfur carrier protein ThiS adenylyltransferase ThiF [Desulfuribacillus stibiiarsenatis]OEH86202.1 thiamine biosynthesis protein ThiF [Desulfuribacillus stibiiarsenatis]